jgi:hypothetical protein
VLQGRRTNMMENLNLPLDFLAEETMVLGEKLTKEKESRRFAMPDHVQGEPTEQLELTPEDRLRHVKDKMKEFLASEDLFTDEIEQKEIYPTTAGLIFRICESAGTYIVRSVCVDNVRHEMKSINEDFEAKDYSKLRLEVEEDILELRYFECETLEQAEVLHELFSNRRLPKEEDVLCNISDPGFSWWLDTQPGKCTIYFKSHGVECAQSYLKLGPLSDINVFRRRMNQLNALLQQHSCGMSIYEDESSLNISVNGQTSPFFNAVKTLILKGELDEDGELLGILYNNITLRFYLQEVALVRRFWLHIEKILNSNQTIQ